MSYAKSQKLSYLISSFTDVRLTTNHTITSKETCGKFLAQHQKRRRMRMFTMRIIHGPRRKLHHYFLSLISDENRKLNSSYLSINTYEIYNERSNSLNKSNKPVCNTLVSTTRIFLENQNCHYFLTIKDTM